MMAKDAFVRLTKGIRAHPFAVLCVFISTIAFFAVLAYLNLTYQLAIAGNVQVIMSALQGANYDDEAIKAGLPFVSAIADVFANYEQLLSNVWKLVLFQIAAFLCIGLWRWALT